MRRLLGRLLGRPRDTLDDARWQALVDRLALVQGLDPDRRERLRGFTARFLGDKAITPAAGLTLSQPMRDAIAALCCLPVLEYGYRGLAGWSQLIIYPGSFRARRSHLDEATGVVIEGEEDLAGEAWEAGPVVLSWDDIAADLEDPEPGFNVAIHEIAHKLDLLDGALDGLPPVSGPARLACARDFQAAFDTLVADVEAGREPPIDDYAASAPEEFFAVVTEYHFTAPAHLRAVMPAVAGHLQAFYGPPPRLTAPAEGAR